MNKRRLRYLLLRALRFGRTDLWQLTPEETPRMLRIPAMVINVVYQTIRSFIHDELSSRAASLTYSTVLSIVPMLAVIVGIAKGFGLQNVVHNALMEALPGHSEQLTKVFTYVENYLAQVQGGLFIGIGLVILLYTVLMLISSIEDALNDIWQAPHSRPWTRRIFDYLGLFLLLPILLTVSSLITLTMTTIQNTFLGELTIFQPLLSGMLGAIPFILSVALFVGLYMFMPNVRVKFVPTLISGIIAGIAYQIFQGLYINGVIWISRYNAIYGSFAAFPLLLLWLQLSWTIVLFGAQLSYAIQNIRSYAYGEASISVSRRYLDFVSIIILTRIIKQFSDPEAKPYSAEELSRECRIPLRMTGRVLCILTEVGLINEINHNGATDEGYYHPAVDPDQLSIAYVIDRLDRFGREDFSIDRHERFSTEWQAMLTSRHPLAELPPTTLLKSL